MSENNATKNPVVSNHPIASDPSKIAVTQPAVAQPVQPAKMPDAAPAKDAVKTTP